MRDIRKRLAPSSLGKHQAALHATYDNYRDKDDLRVSLVRDQKGICCYCMGRIKPSYDAMKIEHWKCQSAHGDLELSYSNLLGACLGGQGSPHHLQHCDTHKGEDALSRNPSTTAHAVESIIQYLGDGTIRSTDSSFDKEINAVLNLNQPNLKSNRKALLTGFFQSLPRIGLINRAVFTKMLREWNGDTSEEVRPYCGVIVYILKKRLERA